MFKTSFNKLKFNKQTPLYFNEKLRFAIISFQGVKHKNAITDSQV